MRDKRRAVLEKLLQVATGANTEWSVTQERIDQALAELDALELSEEEIEKQILDGISYANTPVGGKQKEERANQIAKALTAALKKKRGEHEV